MSKNSHFSAKDLLLGPGHRSTVTCEREAYALQLVSTCTSASIARDNRPAGTLLPTYYRYSAGHLGVSRRPNLLVYSQLSALPIHTLNAIARQILKQYGLCQCVDIFYQSKCVPWETLVRKVEHPGSYHHCTMPVVPQQNAPADLRRSRGRIVSDRIRNEQKSHLLAAQYER